MQVSWPTVARHVALPLAALVSAGGAAAIVLWLRPDDYVNLVLFLTLLALTAWLLVASAFELGSFARRRPLGIARSVVLAIPAGLSVAGLAGLQSMRMVGPLTLITGLLIVLLAEYVLWPRSEP
jgi:drug/metabolite transporter superfamily protein YnfA